MLLDPATRTQQQLWVRPRRVVVGAVVFVVGGLLWAEVASDVALYQRYGLATLHSSVGHVALPKEYPGAAGLVFAVVAALPVNFMIAFPLLMALSLGGLVSIGGRLVKSPQWNLRLLVYLGVGTVAVVFGRYDLLPALASTVAVALAVRHRWGGAWVAAGVGAALKLFPILLLPGFLIAEWRATGRPPWRRVAATAAIGGTVAGLQVAVAPGTLLSPFRYELRRGFGVSSVGGSITAILHPLNLTWHFAFGSWEVVGPGQAGISLVITALTIAALVGTWMLAARGRLSVPAVALTVLTVSILGDHVFSPQYLIWIAPLWALWPLRPAWIATAALTTVVFPVTYAAAAWLPSTGVYVGMYPAVIVAALRNAVLAASLGIWLRDELRGRSTVAGDAVAPALASAWQGHLGSATTMASEGGT